jgi:hypothetical protein
VLLPPVRRRCCVQRSRRHCMGPLCRRRRADRLALRFSGATCPQAEHRCDVRGRDAFNRPATLRVRRATSTPPRRLIARLRPRFCATRTPGWSTVPTQERIIARTSSASTRMLSNRRARSVVSLHPVASPVRFARLDSRDRHLGARCRRLSALGGRRVQPAQPDHLTRCQAGGAAAHRWTAADTTTPRSTPTTLPSAGPGSSQGMYAERDMPAPGRSRVTR